MAILMTKTPAEYGSREHYLGMLEAFDAAACEALAVSQAHAGRMAAANVGYASHVFMRMCGSATSFMRAAPLSRWVRSDLDDWQLSAIAGHARSIFDGYVLFRYLISPTQSDAELKTRINIMHVNDCTRRIKLFKNLGSVSDDTAGFEKQLEELRERLLVNEFFTSLPSDVQKNCLSGKHLMLDDREQMLKKIGLDVGQTNAIYDLWSQHIHILPMSFYRAEPDGRGTGIENDTDRGYMAQALEISTMLMKDATDKIVESFPDTAGVRQGVASKFNPGPRENLPPIRKASASLIKKLIARSRQV